LKRLKKEGQIMPEGKIVKPVLDMENKLQPFTDGMERIKSQVQPQEAIMRAMEQNKSFEELRKNIGAFGQLPQPDFEWVRQAMEMNARFRLPELPEIPNLMKEIRATTAAMNIWNESSGLQQAIERMQAPWLDIQEKMRSVTGFAELQSIGRALENIPAFDESLAASLRLDLGDWRDSITWPTDIFTDWKARSNFYESRGFNKALTDFPASAFAQSLDIAGLRRTPPSLVTLYGDPLEPPAAEKAEDELVTPHKAYDWLYRLESQLRAFIDDVMKKACGPNWAKHRLPNGLYDEWREKKQKAEESGGKQWPLISYADFTDYSRVIFRADNWREIFLPVFGRKEDVQESLQRLYPIRLSTMHARLITQDDVLLLVVESRRLLKVIRR
jgi:hypothetical protein